MVDGPGAGGTTIFRLSGLEHGICDLLERGDFMMEPMDSMQTARVIVSALIDGGVRDVVIGPGSRSAPLVYALAEAVDADKLRLHVRVDERSGAFTAMGMALGSNRPAAILTTSGTAAGNLLPAIMEAAHADIPLVAITADRPAELQGTGANQTTNQQGLYPNHTRTSFTVDGSGAQATQVRASVRGALSQASYGTKDIAPGPVHLNIRFREPLVPAADDVRPKPEAATAAMPIIPPPEADPSTKIEGFSWDQRWVEKGSSHMDDLRLHATSAKERHTVVIAGHGAGSVATDFASAMGLPLFAEPSSNARYGRNAIASYLMLLGNEGGLGDSAHPLAAHIRSVVVFGRPTLSRQLQALLKREDIKKAMYLPKPVGWFEPECREEIMFEDLTELADWAGQGAPGWLGSWQSSAMRAQLAMEEALADRQLDVGRPGAMRTAQLVAGVTLGNLVLGSSSVIRDIDIAWRPPIAPQSTVFAHRGLAGIDGTISTATGIALATGVRTTLLCGDLTFLYDTNGLWLGQEEERPNLDILVINDAGGAIFAGLEHGQVAEQPGMAGTVERFFGTPHNVDIAELCAAHGVPHKLMKDEYELIHTLGDPASGIRVLEIPSDRSARPLVRNKVQQAVRETFV